MPQAKLRIYCGPHDDTNTLEPEETQRDQVTVPLSEVFPLLADAVRCERTWLEDFEDDEITVSTDLYEVILAYQHYRRPTG